MQFAVTIITEDNVSVNDAENDLQSVITGMKGDEGPSVYNYTDMYLIEVWEGDKGK